MVTMRLGLIPTYLSSPSFAGIDSDAVFGSVMRARESQLKTHGWNPWCLRVQQLPAEGLSQVFDRTAEPDLPARRSVTENELLALR
jgi:hypothetical protein